MLDIVCRKQTENDGILLVYTLAQMQSSQEFTDSRSVIFWNIQQILHVECPLWFLQIGSCIKPDTKSLQIFANPFQAKFIGALKSYSKFISGNLLRSGFVQIFHIHTI